MSQEAAALPHLQIYKRSPPCHVDHAPHHRRRALFRHRLVGVVADRRCFGAAYYDWVNWLFGTFIGKVVLFGYTWALVHHLLAASATSAGISATAT